MKFRLFDTQVFQNDVYHELAQSPRGRYYSAAEPLYKPYDIMKGGARAQRAAPGSAEQIYGSVLETLRLSKIIISKV